MADSYPAGKKDRANLRKLDSAMSGSLKRQGYKPGTTAFNQARSLANDRMLAKGREIKTGQDLAALDRAITAGLKKQGLKPGTAEWDRARVAANNELARQARNMQTLKDMNTIAARKPAGKTPGGKTAGGKKGRGVDL